MTTHVQFKHRLLSGSCTRQPTSGPRHHVNTHRESPYVHLKYTVYTNTYKAHVNWLVTYAWNRHPVMTTRLKVSKLASRVARQPHIITTRGSFIIVIQSACLVGRRIYAKGEGMFGEQHRSDQRDHMIITNSQSTQHRYRTVGRITQEYSKGGTAGVTA